MATRILTQQDVRALLPMDVCIDLMASALQVLSRGDAVNPLRRGLLLPDKRGLLGTMPGWMESPEALGLKVVTVFPGNHGTEYDSHQGVVMLFETEHGAPIAIMDASEVTAIRTAAATGAATRALARADAAALAILGTGVQARTHLDAMLLVRPISQVAVYSPDPRHREAFAEAGTRRHGVPVRAAATAREAVEGADIVCTTTSSRDPVLLGEWIAEGTHVNAVGSSIAAARELDSAAVAKARLFVDRRESTVNEAGDYLFALREGAISESHIVAEVGEVLLGTDPGRRGPGEITLFKSLGVAVEDLAAARHVYDRAVETGAGITVDFGGRR